MLWASRVNRALFEWLYIAESSSKILPKKECGMPIYEYQCDGCNAVFEVFQKVSDPAPEAHSCGSSKVHRILSNTSFVLKGTGWYATDYADKSKKTDDKAHKGGKKSDGQQASKSAESASSASGADKSKGGGDASSGGGKSAKP